MLMICHTVSLKAAAALIQVASENQPAATVLWLSERQTSAGWIEDGGRVISIDHREQPWIKALDEILSGRQEAHAEDRPRPKDLNRPHVRTTTDVQTLLVNSLREAYRVLS